MSEENSVVTEADKPFVLALICLTITIALVVLAIVVSYLGLTDILDLLDRTIQSFLMLNGVTWTFYLVKKNGT